MHLYPPFTPSELFGQRVYWVVTFALLATLVASLQWQRNRPPHGRITVLWGVVAIVAFSITVYALDRGLDDSFALVVHFVETFLLLMGFIRSSQHKRKAIAEWVGVLLVLAAFVLLNLPEVANARRNAKRTQCGNTLRSVGRAIYDADIAGDFSPNTGTPTISWRVTLLPYLHAQELSDGYDPTQVWDAPPNHKVGQREPAPFRCSFHHEDNRLGDLACTDYALLTGLGTIFPTPKSVLDLSQIGDGISNTILAVECSGLRIPWTEPRDVDVSRVHMTIDELGPDSGSPSILSSYHTNPSREFRSVHVLMADGSVRSIDPKDTDPEVIRKLTTAKGNDMPADF